MTLSTRFMRIALTAIMAGCGCYLYVFGGNTHEPARYGHSALGWLVRQWLDLGSQSSHGWFIPPISAFLVWRKRHELAAARKETNGLGLTLIIASLFFCWAGVKSQQPRLTLISLIGLTWGIPWYLWGRQVAGILVFPCAYLLFCIPLGFLASSTFPLRQIATVSAVCLLNGLGISTVRSGTAVYSLQTGKFALDVADPCSGLHSIIVMTAVAALYAYLTQKTQARKWALFLASVPIAVAGNIVRIVAIGVAAELFGQESAARFYHQSSGYVVFVVAVVLMIWVAHLLNVDYAGKLNQWKRNP